MAFTDADKAKAYYKAYRDNVRKWCRENGYCTSCFKNKAEPGKALCLDCRMQDKERSKRRVITEEQRQRHNETKRARRARLIASGICTQCAKRPVNGKQVCDYCRNKIYRRKEQKRVEQGLMTRCLMGNGVYCSRCGKPTEGGAKLCPRCLASMPKNHGTKNSGFAKGNALFWDEMSYRKAAKGVSK